jgi:hypothetical protein
MKKITILHLVLILLTVLALTSVAADGGRKFTTTLTGAAEIPGPGDPDGSGTAALRLNPGQEEICYEITVSNITLPAIGAHIHVGTVTEAGPVVVPLQPPDETGVSEACVSASRDLIQQIIQNPESYYVNVHTTDFPGGAVRGQLSK